MAPGMWQILIAVFIALVVFGLFGGRGRISAMMGDFAKGITAFRKGLKDEADDTAQAQAGEIEAESGEKDRTKDGASGS